MWGGVKPRGHYGELFRRWSTSHGVDELRLGLRHEPRPWYLAYELHQHNHLLPDHHCARLMSWCTTITQLRRGLSAQQEAYRYAQDTFSLFVHSHKAGPGTFSEYMRLCAVGKDLSSAFRWYQYWLETGRDGAGSALQCAWLLRLALLTPSDERAEDMVAAMRQVYGAHYGDSYETQSESGARMSGVATGRDDLVVSNVEGAREQREIMAAFKLLAPRVQDTKLRAFLDALPISTKEAKAVLQAGWPGTSHHHVFPHLEHGVTAPCATLRQPRLRDSLLHPDFTHALETAAFAQDVPAVMALMQQYGDQLERDAERQEHNIPKAAPQTGWHCWRQEKDSTAVQFRHELLAHRDGFTAELYHYLIVALAPRRPSAALRTLQRMRDAGLRILDLTRTVVLAAAADGAWDEQVALFKEQLSEIAARRALDADFDITKDVELYWKYQYALFFHYRNALDEEAFYLLLLDGIGAAALQRLMLAADVHGPTCREERDLVLLDPALRRAAVRHFRQSCRDMASVQAAMDVITTHMAALDLSLMAALPHFDNYALDADDDIATDVAALRSKLQAYDTIYLLDTSFVETSEGFIGLGAASTGAEDKPHGSSLVLVPFVTLAQLARSTEMAAELVTLDTTLQEAVHAEPQLAAERLRALYAMLCRPSRPQTSRVVRVLHFTECLLAHAVPHDTLDKLELQPGTSDNDHLVLLAAMLRALTPATTKLVICTDDPSLQRQLDKRPLFAQPVAVLSTPTPASIDLRTGLLNDNPDLGCEADFCPKLDFAEVAARQHGTTHSPNPQALLIDDSTTDTASYTDIIAVAATRVDKPSVTHDVSTGRADAVSPWIALLQDDGAVDPINSVTPSTGSSSAVEDAKSWLTTTRVDGADEEHEARLMELYESPHEVVPIGVKMQAASARTSVFAQFDVRDPDEPGMTGATTSRRRGQKIWSQAEAEVARMPRRLSTLAGEALAQRGLSNRERYRLARSLSNYVGGRVPFNLRYRKVEANVLDPRNAALRALYERGIEQKRAAFKRNMHHNHSPL